MARGLAMESATFGSLEMSKLQAQPEGLGQLAIQKMRAESPRFTNGVGFSIDSNGLRTFSSLQCGNFYPALRTGL
jgi:hypothetical protein